MRTIFTIMPKNLLSFLFCLMITCTLFGQNTPTWFIGNATADVSGDFPEFGSDGASFGINLKAGRFINDRIVLGATVFGRVFLVEGREPQTDADFLPFGRYYLRPNQPLRYFGELSVNNWSEFIMGVSGGLNYDLGGGLALETSIGVPVFTEDFSVGLGLGFTFFLDNQFGNTETEVSNRFRRGDLLVGAISNQPLNGSTILGSFYRSDFDAFSLALQPSVGYFLTEQLVGGIGIGYINTSINFISDVSITAVDSDILTINPFARFYLTKTARRNQFFAQVDYFYQRTWREQLGPFDFSTTDNLHAIGGLIGVNRFITSHLALAGGLGYRSAINQDFGRASLYVQLGVQAILPAN